MTFSENDISYNSLLGKILIGKKIGEKFEASINKESFKFQILEIKTT